MRLASSINLAVLCSCTDGDRRWVALRVHCDAPELCQIDDERMRHASRHMRAGHDAHLDAVVSAELEHRRYLLLGLGDRNDCWKVFVVSV